jgi:UrcA family protein
MSLPTLRWSLLGVVSLASAMPVLAQPAPPPPPEEVVIVGHYGRIPDSVQSLSMPVGYADLDLGNPADREILRRRIALTARYLCDKLGESDTGTLDSPSCRNVATQDALRRVGTIEAYFAPRGTAWVRPPAWVPPYPNGWVQQYP